MSHRARGQESGHQSVIRPVAPEDRAAIWSLLCQFARTYEPEERSFLANFPDLCADQRVVFLVHEFGGTVVGYLVGHELATLFANGPILELTELVVDEHHRRQGLGSALVDRALQVAWDRNCREVVVPTRRASAFYERLAFTKSAEFFKRSHPTSGMT